MEGILNVIKEDTLINFFISALSRFSIPDKIFITTDGYHYESILKIVSNQLQIPIRRQRRLFHIEKVLLIKYMNRRKKRNRTWESA